MSRNNEFWDKVFDGLEAKYVNETTDEINRNLGDEGKLVEIIVEKPSKKRFNWRTPAALAAAAVLIVGGVSLVGRLSEIDTPSTVAENTTGYVSASVYKGEHRYLEANLSDNDETTAKVIELIKLIDSIELHATDYVPLNYEADYYTLVLNKPDGESDVIKLDECYKNGFEPYYFLTKNGIAHEITETDYNAVYAYLEALSEKMFPVYTDGNYYLNDNTYITIDSDEKTIALKGSEAYAFVSEQELSLAGETELNGELEKMVNERYELLSGDSKYEIYLREDAASSSKGIWDSALEMFQIESDRQLMLYDYEIRLENDGYTEPVFCYSAAHSPSILLYGYEFRKNEAVSIELERDYPHAEIAFSETRNVSYLGINGITSAFKNESDAHDFYNKLTGNGGIERIGAAAASGMVFDSATYNDSEDNLYGKKYIKLSYKNDANGLMNIIVSEDGDKKYGGIITMPCDEGLTFAGISGVETEERLSYIRAYDGTELEARIGGARYENEYYYLAQWEKGGLYYCVSTGGVSNTDFLDALSALICNTDSFGDIVADYVEIPYDESLYTFDFSIFYNYFRGIWSKNTEMASDNEDSVVAVVDDIIPEEINIGWNDNLFSYNENDLKGFYTDQYGAYMMGEAGVWYVPENDKKLMRFYPEAADTDIAYVEYSKTGTGDVNGFTGMYGWLGFIEVCTNYGIDHTSFFGIEVTDVYGKKWVRNADRFSYFPDVAVSVRNSEELELLIRMDAVGSDENSYISFCFTDNGNGFEMSNEHYPYDVSVLSADGLSTELSQSVAERVRERAEEIEGYRLVIESEFYPCTDGSYYAVRLMGGNQQQWLSDLEVFYNDGSGYKLISDKYTTFMGSVRCAFENDRLYFAYADSHNYMDERNLFVDCIENGTVASTFPLELKEGDGAIITISSNENVLTVCCEFFDGETEKKVMTIDYTDPYNPILLATHFPVSTAAAIPQEPIEGYTHISEVGKHAYPNKITLSNMSTPTDGMYEVAAANAEKIAYNNGEMIMLSLSEGKGFTFSTADRPYIGIIPDYSADYSDSTGELVEVGYIKNGFAFELFSGKVPPEGLSLEFAPPEDNEYYFYVLNCSAGMQNYKLVGVAIE